MRDPLAAGFELADRILAQLNDDPPPVHIGGPLHWLIGWMRESHDTRWLNIHVTVDGESGDPVWAFEVHNLEPCPRRLGTAVDHVFHGAGRTLVDAAADAVRRIDDRVSTATTEENPPCP